MKLIWKENGPTLTTLSQAKPGDCFYFPDSPEIIWMVTSEIGDLHINCTCVAGSDTDPSIATGTAGAFEKINCTFIIQLVNAEIHVTEV